MTTVKMNMSDMLFNYASFLVQEAAKVGITLKMTDVYNQDTAESLAFITGLGRQVIEKAAHVTIEVVQK